MNHRARVASDLLISLALCAWVGGRSALGAFAARITFQSLPREQAAPTMNAIFRSFDVVVWGALFAIAIALLIELIGRPRSRWLLIGGAMLMLLGLFDLLYIEPGITELWTSGTSTSMAFARLHQLSERSAHLELGLAIALFIVMAQRRVRAP